MNSPKEGEDETQAQAVAVESGGPHFDTGFEWNGLSRPNHGSHRSYYVMENLPVSIVVGMMKSSLPFIEENGIGFYAVQLLSKPVLFRRL